MNTRPAWIDTGITERGKLGIEVLAGDIYLTTEPPRGGGLINDREARRRAAEVFKVMEVDIDPGAVLGNLSTEIAKALAQDAQGADHG